MWTQWNGQIVCVPQPEIQVAIFRGITPFSTTELRRFISHLVARSGKFARGRDKIIRMAARKKIHGHNTRFIRVQRNYCFACGKHNPDSMRLRFAYDKEEGCFVCRFRLGKRYTGPPGHCHGGIIATILDEAMGKVNTLRNVVAVTAEITVNYLKPVPLNKPLRVESWETKVKGRRHIHTAEILNQKGEVLARGRGLFIVIDPHKMFGKFVER
jgi:uncharacterized protein (TIGR00369 family)